MADICLALCCLGFSVLQHSAFECSAPAAMTGRNSNLFLVIGGIFYWMRSKRETDSQATPNPGQLTSVFLSGVLDTVLNLKKLLTYLMKSIWIQISKISAANKNHQIPNNDFLSLTRDLHRKEIGSSAGGTFPTEPDLKQNPGIQSSPGTGIFPLRNGTKKVFIDSIKNIFILECSSVLVKIQFG